MIGRPSEVGVPREHFLRVRCAPFELAQIDAARGTATRSDFIRGAVIAACQNGGEKK